MTVDRTAPPPPSSARSYSFPPFSRHRLSNGLQVLAARRSEIPVVGIGLLMPAGGQFDPLDRPGLAALTADLLDEGTSRRNATEIADSVERLGGHLSSGCDWDIAYVGLDVLSGGLDEGLDTFADVATGPSFPTTEIDRLRRERLDEIHRRQDNPAVVAGDAFGRVLYEGTVYANPLIGSERSLEALGLDDFQTFYQRHMATASPSHVIAVGAIDPEQLVTKLERRLSTPDALTSKRGLITSPDITPPIRDRVSVTIVDRPESAQTELRVGHVGVPRQTPGRAARVVMNALLGGKFTSRINLNLRERHGYTYGAHSRFADRMGPGPFVISTAVANDVAGAACRELISEVDRICNELVTVNELDDTKSYLLGVFPYGMQTLGGLSSRLEVLAVHDLPDDYYANYLQELREVGRDDVREAARQHLHPERLAVVAVGPASDLPSQLAPLGDIEVVPLASADRI